MKTGRYLYGVATGGVAGELGPIGIGHSNVYTISYNDFCAIVHDCAAVPYQSNDSSIVKEWVLAHQTVLDVANKLFSAVIPAGFDTIVQPSSESVSPSEAVQDWLKRDYERLSAVAAKIRERDEYGVQVLYEPAVMTEQMAERSPEIQKLRQEIVSKSPGLAYICRQKLERALKAEMEKLAGNWSKDYFDTVKGYCDDIVIEKTRTVDAGRVMLLNLSCLVARLRVRELGTALDKINSTPGFGVRFTGPWPAYSFVAKLAVPAGEEAR